MTAIMRSPAQQAAARANGARSRGPATTAGKARAARNGTRHGLRGGPFAPLPGEDADELAWLRAAVAADWRPRDAHERHWVKEVVAALWRQDRLRGLELSALAAAEAEGLPSEASLRRLLTLARYGARLDKDLGAALRALRALKGRPAAALLPAADDAAPPCTPGPEARTRVPDDVEPRERNCTNEFAVPPPRTPVPEARTRGREARTRVPDEPRPHEQECTNEVDPPAPRTRGPEARTRVPEPAAAAPSPATAPAPPNRRERRRLAALDRQARRRAA